VSGRIFLCPSLYGVCSDEEFIESVHARQVIKYVELNDMPNGGNLIPLSGANDADWSHLLNFLRQYSRDHRSLLSLKKAGEGGQSSVLMGDMPGNNVVLKIPRVKDGYEGAEGAMEET
jgi:hypothetical protein